jgi:hypothetical protein
MPPACALLAMAAPAPHEARPFRFLDLPAEIRCVIYELLMDRRVKVGILDVECPSHDMSGYTQVPNYYYPAMMRVNIQVKDEYTAFVMPRMKLLINWTILGLHQVLIRAKILSPLILPELVFSQLKFLDLRVCVYSSDPGKLLWWYLLMTKNATNSTHRRLECDVSNPQSHI